MFDCFAGSATAVLAFSFTFFYVARLALVVHYSARRFLRSAPM